MGFRDLLKDRINPSSWIKEALFGGIGCVCITITYQFFEVLKSQPELLLRWGPNVVLWLLGITVAGILGNALIEAVRNSGESLVESTKAQTAASIQNAEGMKQMAEAVQRIADQGDGQMREIQAQTAYVAQQMVRVMDRLSEHGELLAHISATQRTQGKGEGVEQ